MIRVCARDWCSVQVAGGAAEADWVLPTAIKLFETACLHGWDRERGGVRYTIDQDGTTLDGNKYYWALAEMIAGQYTCLCEGMVFVRCSCCPDQLGCIQLLDYLPSGLRWTFIGSGMIKPGRTHKTYSLMVSEVVGSLW